MRHPILRALVLVAFIFTALVRLNAQDVASLTGTVVDATGAVIPGTTVELTNPSRGLAYKQSTDTLGLYRFLNVPAGPGYQISVSHEGFAAVQISDISLSVGQTRTQNVALSVGAESQTVSVSASDQIVTLNTTDSTVGNNIDVEQLNELPVYDRVRGISTLMYQQPGVDPNQGSVTGARIDQSSVTLDGLDVNDQATGQTFYLTSPAPIDSLQQFTGSVAGLTSSTGTGSGGQFTLVTKSGSNQFHGGVSEYHRDTALVANPWFNNLTGLKRTNYIRNQFGASIGGPIKRDKLFFFFNWLDSRIVRSGTSEPIVPLDNFRNGTLNYINNNAGCTGSATLTTAASCISTLSAGDVKSLDPAGIGFNAPMLSYINTRYPHANDFSRGDGVNTGGYRFTYAAPDTNATYTGRIDYNLNSAQTISGRFTINRRDGTSSAPMFPNDPLTHPILDRSYAYVVWHSWNIGNNKVNKFYYGDTVSKLSFPDLYNPLGANQPSFSGFDGPYTDFNGQKRRFPVPEVRDDFSWQIRSHTLNFGGTFKFMKNNSNLISNFNFPSIGQAGAALSSGLEDSVRPANINQAADGVGVQIYDSLFPSALGVLGQISTNYSYDNKGTALPAGAGAPRAYRFYQTEAYFGDTWKINRKLTMSYGVRWQYYTVPYETKGFQSVESPISLDSFVKARIAQQKAGNTSPSGLPFYSVMLGGKANHGPNLYEPSYKDFAPRVAFSFSPFDSQKTIFNLGGGIIYDRSVIDAINFLQDQLSYLFFNQQIAQFGSNAGAAASLKVDPRVGNNLSYSNSLNPAPQAIKSPLTPYVDSTGIPYGLGAGQTNFTVDPHLKDPYSIALNFGVQQELPGHFVLKINYVGRLGRRLLADADANQVIDVPDYTGKSTQTMSQAFAGLTAEMRAGKTYRNVTPQPWFEDVLYKLGGLKNTQYLSYYGGSLVKYGDISDTIYAMNAIFGTDGFFPLNIGIPAQFGANTYLTNKGSSNYHGMLVTLDKNMSHGLRFEANYTWSHSIDNTSVSANANSLFTNSDMICDILNPRACRGDSDFDIRQEFNGNFIYNLPFGRKQTFMSNAPRWADEAFGGWSISGVPIYRGGLPLSANSNAYLASFDNAAPAIFTGTSKADLETHVNVNHTSKVVYMFDGGSAGAAKVLSEFRGPLGIEYGQRNLIRGPRGFFFDAGLGKTFPIYEKLNLNFRADAFNVFNHPVFGTSLDGIGVNTGMGAGALNIVTNASRFGQLTRTEGGPSATNSGARVAQLSLRLDF